MDLMVPFWLFFVSSIMLIGWHGDFFARAFAAFLVCMTVLTYALNIMLGMDDAWKWVILIHVAIFLVALLGAFTSSSYWPMWFAAFQFNSVAAGLAQWVDGNEYLRLYAYTASLWAIPALCAAVIGVLRDSQLRQSQRQGDANSL
ncbi:MAG: hypothetical protein HC788_11360 [Sphingopyxis sp.]|nr:hypothetical protein [Sphingopyxis sp.]